MNQRLYNYAKRNLQRGYSIRSIRQTLLNSGYPPNEVNDIINYLTGQSTQTEKQPVPASIKSEPLFEKLHYALIIMVIIVTAIKLMSILLLASEISGPYGIILIIIAPILNIVIIASLIMRKGFAYELTLLLTLLSLSNVIEPLLYRTTTIIDIITLLLAIMIMAFAGFLAYRVQKNPSLFESR